MSLPARRGPPHPNHNFAGQNGGCNVTSNSLDAGACGLLCLLTTSIKTHTPALLACTAHFAMEGRGKIGNSHGGSNRSQARRGPSGAWNRLKPVTIDPLDAYGLPSKGDKR